MYCVLLFFILGLNSTIKCLKELSCIPNYTRICMKSDKWDVVYCFAPIPELCATNLTHDTYPHFLNDLLF